MSDRDYKFALVSKNKGNPWFTSVKAGCEDQARRLLSVTCLYEGPEEANADEQMKIVRSLIDDGVDGIALSVIDAEKATPVINDAVDAGIPVVTFDSDAEASKRSAYIGTNNTAFGFALGKLLDQLAPEGGKYGVITAGSPNVMERWRGLQKHLENSNWVEVSDQAKDCDDDIGIALEKMYELAAEPGIRAIVPVGGWPMFNETGWKKFVNAHRHLDLKLIVGDALQGQITLINQGYSDGLVGQLPYNMGEVSMTTLLKLKNGEMIAMKDDQSDLIYGTALLEILLYPIQLPDPNVDYNYLGGLAIMGYVLFAIIALLSMAFLVFTILYRNQSVVKKSQPFFLVIVCVGVLLFGSSILPLSVDDEKYSQTANDVACVTFPWLMSIGFSTTFAALFSKLWRINQIVKSSAAIRKVTIKATDVLLPFAVLLTMNIIVLVCFTVITPPKYVRTDHLGTDIWNQVISNYGSCTFTMTDEDNTGGAVSIILLAIVNIMVLVVANIEAYRARDVHTEYSESSYIGLILASLLQVAIIVTPVIFLVQEQPRARYTVVVFAVFVCCMSVLLFMFVPKILYVYTTRKEELNNTVGLKMKRKSFEPIDFAASNSDLCRVDSVAASNSDLSRGNSVSSSNVDRHVNSVERKPATEMKDGLGLIAEESISEEIDTASVSQD